MNELILKLKKYLVVVVHPFKSQENFRYQRENIVPITGPQNELVQEPLSFEDAVMISWGFKIADGLYSIVAILIGVMVFNSFRQDMMFDIFQVQTKMVKQSFFLLFVLSEVVMFPLMVWLYVKVWKVVIRFFVNIYNMESDKEEAISEVVNSSISSHVFLLFPLFGKMFKAIYSIFLIFAGLRKNLGMSAIQSIIILISPLMLIALLLMLMGIFFMLLFA